ncbi:MAG: Na/Pi cotransporter family protein [Tissierellia bacterium]|nr:Na/Pi cotransporter family protein [Tissierellia bacterium]
MSISYLFSLLGGLAIFLFGMDLMSTGLELLAGKKLHSIIARLTSSTRRGIVVGLVVTAIIQSSSATTVMAVGFVNAGLMTLQQAVGVIMGANIGTTVTGQLVALNITQSAPVMAFIGFILFKFTNKNAIKHSGEVLMGLGLLFMGMEIMSTSMSPLRENPTFVHWMTTMTHPVLGVFIGALVTAVIQSSSASLGILQAIANKGLIGLHASMFIICGFNIGTCINSVISAMGSSKNGKRTAVVHILFNVIGTIVFLILANLIPVEAFILKFSKDLPAAQIANMHTLFNIFTTAILLPFSNSLANLATNLIRGTDPELEDLSLKYINFKKSQDAMIILTDVRAEATRMLEVAKENFFLSIDIFNEYDEKKHKQILHNEEIINYLNSNITKYIIDVLKRPMDEHLTSYFTGYLRIVRDLERVGDHTKSIAEYSQISHERELTYSSECQEEMELLNSYMDQLYETLEEEHEKGQRKIIMRAIDESVEKDVAFFRNRHLERMKSGICDPESGLIYEKMLSNYERISAYLKNIGKLALGR